MSWAARRRFIILLVVGIVVAAFAAIVLISTIYKTPTCTDGVKNQNEAGVDCGGPCPYLCMADEQPPTVLYTKTITNSAGRTDIIASVENKNAAAAAKDVPYRVTFYDSDSILLGTISGMLDLPPGATVPVYIPSVLSSGHKVANAFLSIDSSAPRWYSAVVDPRVVPAVSDIVQGGSVSAPRIEAILTNPSAYPLTNVQVIVVVENIQKEVLAASQTVVLNVPPEGQATAVFTWNDRFPGTPASIDIVPIIPLP